ncbi:MAG: DUF1559 domain-containing protein [Pirellulaceae bacterium]|jgi:prepilin-type N-terminal cleavage/methylation domain-containing protein/prepilin-type processing-associated H-X9-DG protein|nr:DUF1559 domain-containing protein [Pirellulaceae bacterium]
MNLRKFSNVSPPRAFTLIELLVVIAIIGILVGLLLPAVQSVREAARRTQCLNNMRQVALAVANYESTLQAYPVNMIGPGPDVSATKVGTGYYSWLVWILPYLEGNNLYDSIDTSFNMSSNIVPGGPHSPFSIQIEATHPNAVAAATPVATFLCPSDTISHANAVVFGDANPASGSYAANMGWPKSVTGYNGERPVPGKFNGVIPIRYPAPTASLAPTLSWHPKGRWSSRDIIDGTSNTCMVSERLVQAGQSIPEINASDRRLQSHHVSRAAMTLSALANQCGPPTHTDAPYGAYVGRAWIVGWAPAGNMYVHLTAPNTNNGHFTGSNESSERQGDFIVAPSSRHPGGVNVAFADGSTRFVPNQVDLATWWALGSSNQGDLPGPLD